MDVAGAVQCSVDTQESLFRRPNRGVGTGTGTGTGVGVGVGVGLGSGIRI